MLRYGVRLPFPLTASIAGVALIMASAGASAQQRRPAAPMAAPHVAPPHVAAPRAMARPAAPAFHPAPAPRPMPHVAAPSRPMPHFAAPSRQIVPRSAASRPSVHRPAIAARPTPHITAPNAALRRPGPSSAARVQQPQIPAGAQHRQARVAQRQQALQQRQRDLLTRQTEQRQTRIDRLQQRVQQLQAQNPKGRRAQRELQTQQRLLSRAQTAQQRELARQQKLGPTPATSQNARAAATTAAAAQAAARGRFAAHFRNNADPQAQAALKARLNGWSPRLAWRHGVHAAFVPWLGPVFWPFAYADIFDYTFWPDAYDDAYWAYAYDDFVDTVFWDAGSPYSAYASLAPDEYLEPGGAIVGSSRVRERSSLSQQAVRQLCTNPARGVTAWPFADITREVKPTREQRGLLDQLRHAAAEAANAFKTSCSDTYALTPPGRVQAMINRISAALEAVRIVRQPLEAFYNSLSDEQKARFNALGPKLPAAPQEQAGQQTGGKPASCAGPKKSLTQLPIERIEAVVRPTGSQKDALDRLNSATRKAVETLQAACPNEVPLTPVGRLDVMEKRLSAMLQAANTVLPELDAFYATLSSEQKARFNTLQQVATD